MRIRALQVLALGLLVLLLAIPRGTPWRIRAGRSRTIEDAVERLGSSRFEERRRAQNLLVSLGEASRGALSGALRSRDAEVRHRAAAALRALERAREDPDDRRYRELFRIVALALRQPDALRAGSDARTALSLDPETAARAVVELARRAEAHPGLHANAVRLLGSLGRHEGAAYLAGLLREGDHLPSVLRDAAEGILAAGRPGVRDDLRAALRGPYAAARRQAARVLGSLGTGEDFDLLVAAAADTDPRVRAAVAAALAETGLADAAPALRTLCRDREPEVRVAALDALSTGRWGGVREAMFEALDDPEARVREVALTGLLRCGRPEDAETVRGLLTDGSARVRAAAIETISFLAEPDEAVVGGLRDLSPRVRRVALTAALRMPRAARREALANLPDEEDPYLMDLRRHVAGEPATN